MKPIGQLFGLMVERIQGCPYTVVKEDMRESLAIDLLFGSALNACKKQGNLDDFLKPNTALRRSPRNLKPKEAVTTSKQTKMDSYFAHKMMIEEYDAQKKKAVKALKNTTK